MANRTLKFRDNDEHRVFFFTDFHHSHNPDWSVPLWKLRGFDSVIEHNIALTNNWNNKVSNNDTVFLLGDTVVGAGNKSEETFRNLLEILNYKELYIMEGNHGAGYNQIFSNHLEMNLIDKYYRLTEFVGDKQVHFIPNYYEIYVNGQPIVLCHYPILSWNGIAHGAWMLHGHCHGTLHKTDWVEENYYKGKVLDVGPEYANGPLSFNEIRETFNDRENLEIDHHTGSTSSPFAHK